jgi:hypothetical protein
MHKRRAGLQKEISKIFTGVQIPKQDASEAATRPAAPVPAKYIPPKPVAPAPAPRPFTIPEPSQYTPLPKQTTYEPPKQTIYEPPKQTTYEPPKQTIYESPALTPIVRQPQPEPVTKPHRQIPLLKIWGRISAKFFASKPGGDSRRQKIMILAMPVLLMVFIFVLTRVLRTPASSGPKSTNKSSSSGGAVAFDGKIDWELPPLYPETLRDPMVFGNVVVPPQEDTTRPMVKGIVYSEDNPCAVVGDRIVSAGDVVQGATVVKINRDSVEFAIGDKNWTQKVER